MQITELSIKNLRSIEELRLDLYATVDTPRRRLILLGANGAGKTTILDALVHAFQAMAPKTASLGGQPLSGDDVRTAREEGKAKDLAQIVLSTVLSKEELDRIRLLYPEPLDHGVLAFDIWRSSAAEEGEEEPEATLSAEAYSGADELDESSSFADAVRAALREASPPCLFLPAGRGVLEESLDFTLRDIAEFDPCRDCLSRSRSRFVPLSFRLAAAFGGGKRLDPRGAIGRMWKVLAKHFPELPRPVHSDGIQLTFDTGKALVPLRALSDGEKALLLIFGEIALRPPEHGILLIDEVEQHLHPKWQRAILQALTSMIPSAQIVLSTQSPYLAASAPDDVREIGDWKSHGE